MTAIDTGAPVEWKKYQYYELEVDPVQDDKAKEIKLCSFSRPHMRAFHCSWMGFFIAFFIWFAISPLLSEIAISLDLSKEEIWTSSIVGVGGDIFIRFMLGPLCDKIGSRVLFTVVLILASIPTACTGFVNTATGLSIVRMFIGIAGGSFVMCQYWTSRMFTREVVGTANALVGGWGNLGGGVTQLVMGSALFPLFKVFFNDDAEKAWRTVSVVPAAVTVCIAIVIFFFTDDAPKGNYSDLKKHGSMPEVSVAASFRAGACNLNTWILFIQYACCFGVELTMNNAAALYFKDEFDLSTEEAAAIASIFGWMNLFARGLGGYLSDHLNSKFGMRGRLGAQSIFLLLEGALVMVFANTGTLVTSIVVMIFFSLFAQGAQGSTYGIVPYIDPPSTGSISGIVGAGGNTGAVCFGFGFRNLRSYKDAFVLMGACILVSSILSAFVFIKKQSGLVCGKEEPTPMKAARRTLAIPEPDAAKADDVNEDDQQEEA